MKQFDIEFIGEYGKYTLEKCENMPTKGRIEATIEACELMGTGKITKIVIKNIKR